MFENDSSVFFSFSELHAFYSSAMAEVRPKFHGIFIHTPDIHYVRPFGCRMLYHPVTSRLPTFKSRLPEGLCIGQDGGRVYKFLTEEKVVMAKHKRAIEEEFPGTARIRQGVAEIKNG